VRKLAEEALLKAGALQSAIFNSANFPASPPTPRCHPDLQRRRRADAGLRRSEVMNKITPADISDPQELIAVPRR